MIKAQYTDPAFQNHGFWNHSHHLVVDAGVYPGTTEPLIELYKIDLVQNLQAASGTGGKPRNIALFRKAIPIGGTMLSGAWTKIWMWVEGVDYDESSAAASVGFHPITGNLHVVLSFGRRDANGSVTYQQWEEQINRSTFAPPIERLPPASGGLSARYVEALERTCDYLNIP